MNAKQSAITSNRAFLTILVVAAIAIVAIVFGIALGADVGNVLVVVICIGVVGVFIIGFVRGISTPILALQRERNRHVEALISKDIDPYSYLPIERKQTTPKLSAPVSDVRYSDPRRGQALKVLTATVDGAKYGPQSNKIITQKDALEVGIAPNDWSSGVDYLRDFFGVATGNTGTIIKEEGKTVSRVFAEFASVARDVESSAVGALPEAKR